MQSFELLRKHFAMCGVENSPKNQPFNVKNVSIFILVYVNVSLIGILLNEVDTFHEITDILLRSVSDGTCGIVYLIIVWKTSNISEFMNNLESTVNASKRNVIQFQK